MQSNLFSLLLLCIIPASVHTGTARTVSRVVRAEKNESVAGGSVIVHLTGHTQVTQAFFGATTPRVYVDSSPHTVADARLSYTGFRGFYGTLAYRHTINYRLDGEDASIRASGLDVLDLSIRQRIRSWIDFNFSIKRYLETQNFFESRARLGDPLIARIHGTPGDSIG